MADHLVPLRPIRNMRDGRSRVANFRPETFACIGRFPRKLTYQTDTLLRSIYSPQPFMTESMPRVPG